MSTLKAGTTSLAILIAGGVAGYYLGHSTSSINSMNRRK